MLEDLERAQFVSLLAWYGELGIDAVLGEEPIDWTARPAAAPGEAVRARLREAREGAGAAKAAPPAAAPSQPRTFDQSAGPRRPQPPVRPAIRSEIPTAPMPQERPAAPRDPGVQSARSTAAAANSLADLRAALESFDGCALKATARNTCLYRGAERAPVMIIGEAPGRDEDLEGRPFVGRAGQLLDRMLAAIGLTENDVHITNVVYWRPPGNRTPTPQETEICRPFLERQIRLVEPQMLFVLGGSAAKSILAISEGIMRVRGKWKQISVAGVDIPVLPSLHPAYLLRTPAAKRQAWRDLLSLRAALDAAQKR